MCYRSITDLAGGGLVDNDQPQLDRMTVENAPFASQIVADYRPRPLPCFLQTAPSIARGAEGGDNRKQQLLVLLSAFPSTDEDAEQFALRGNFTDEATNIKKVKVRTTTDEAF